MICLEPDRSVKYDGCRNWVTEGGNVHEECGAGSPGHAEFYGAGRDPGLPQS